jgi:beta-lactamase class A
VYRSCGTLPPVLATLVAAALFAPAWTPGVRAADAYADARAGSVAFAVRTDDRLWGRDVDRRVQSASVVKALLLVAYLRQPGVRARALRRDEVHLLSPMVRWSNNRRAGEVATRLGAARVDRVARRGGMPGFHLVLPCWGCSLITAREQSRFFLHIDALVPTRHRAFAMTLLRTVVHTQRWGIAEVAPAGWTLYFKGGWGNGTGLVDHQVALLQRGRERVSVAILTTVSGTHREGKATLRGVARRLLRGL